MSSKILFSTDFKPEERFARANLLGSISEDLIEAKCKAGPSVLVVRQFVYSADVGVVAVEKNDVVSAFAGPDDHWLIVADRSINQNLAPQHTAFSDECRAISDDLGDISEHLMKGLREIDKAVDLSQNSAGRWINKGVNFFTLKPQPRKRNIQFTLYGNPNEFDHSGFLLKDQNSYSRGWINNLEDVDRFITFATESYAKRKN